MSKVFYSPSEGGFFHEAVHGERRIFVPDPAWIAPERPIIPLEVDGVVMTDEDGEPLTTPDWDWRAPPHPHVEKVSRESAIPDDAVEIAEGYWRELLDGQAQGKRIVPGDGGSPVLMDAPSADPARVLARLRKERNRRLAASDWTQLPDVPAKTRDAWAAYRQALRDLPANTEDPANIAWPAEPA